MLAIPALAQAGPEPSPNRDRILYRWSVVAITAGNAADTVTSWNHLEGNPLLTGPGAQFGAGSMAIKSGLLGATLLMEHWTLRHNSRLYHALAWTNFAISGGLAGAAVHNSRLP